MTEQNPTEGHLIELLEELLQSALERCEDPMVPVPGILENWTQKTKNTLNYLNEVRQQFPRDTSPWKVNRLTAAAPELLAALNLFLTAQESRRHPLGAPDEGIATLCAKAASEARAAIAKATGKETT